MASQEEAGGSRPRKEPIEDLLKRLELQEEEEDNFVWEEEFQENQVAAKWLAIAKVHTDKGFSPSALYSDMRSAWNPVREPRWRRIEDNLFTVQFGCLDDWNTTMNMGPWLFRDMES